MSGPIVDGQHIYQTSIPKSLICHGYYSYSLEAAHRTPDPAAADPEFYML